MFHSFTLTINILLPISAGARIVICESVKPFRRLLKRIVTERVSIIAAVPAFYEALCKTKVPGLSLLMRKVRFCVSGSAPLPADMIEKFERKYSAPLLEGYGLSEASPAVSMNPLDGVRKAGTVGMPLPRVEVRILNEEGLPVDTGQEGEIAVRGPNIMQGYLRMPEETDKVMRDGWLLTGDIGCMDEDGCLRIVDRKKDLILHRGMNVYPREIEDVLSRDPRIKESAIVGAAHSSHGEIPVAHVILEDGASITEQEIKDYCREHLADYKVPRAVHFADDFPRTATGKVMKRKLREQCGS
jgi:long-chain acyl-CoA synthetase